MPIRATVIRTEIKQKWTPGGDVIKWKFTKFLVDRYASTTSLSIEKKLMLLFHD